MSPSFRIALASGAAALATASALLSTGGCVADAYLNVPNDPSARRSTAAASSTVLRAVFDDARCLAPRTGTAVAKRQTRRDWFRSATGVAFASGAFPSMAFATVTSLDRPITDASSGELPDFPPEAVRSYLQYRFSLQLAADFYLFDLQSMVADTDEFGAVNDLVQTKNSRGGGGQPSRIERDYINPMRIIGLSLPPDFADDIRSSQFAFEKAMSKMTKATTGIRRDLPVEVEKNAIPDAKAAWEEGRLALNSFFLILNTATGLKDELRPIPPPGPNQLTEYGRSIRRYNTFTKKTKQCQNRGGPTLSAAWGQLMVSGYLQDSCGVEPLEGYFFQ